ncbi:type II toxin-antitoxin system PemK/MazF family toxin [Arcanobacterium haemolyticum]|uniref:PemK family protein n=1 Tax=Arcanobacterium haemolyticum (strain ATCC 9345 / DSM 20595 / CCM 5947 / CCUG 17215 / LMG 16163 / NBRC 15585 / NCTC 8452 / 11018) TaxID=644284 RepID=D7BP62_ARCHD|nr:type II toxin-antitoxin system PemK/MazF family toxin [Arcanobacterium haemolyticum]ADH92711.1 hypothetical protein Arch_0991 [Arcanobacterium haemolyticum DSM 20595]QCX46817.1 type II toxin-antitoxin system PemK/MazF family toxin [Arcanobacterium haemolyticum]SQH28548.1 PemK-like protein [Arcanobacterium haemolyticum]
MSLWNRLSHVLIDLGVGALKSALSSSSSSPRSAGSTSHRTEKPAHTPSPGTTLPSPYEHAIDYDVRTLGMPRFAYNPVRNDAPDPGEVVWTWVPYEENDGRGKDRPVLVAAMYGPDHVVFAQTTSKDHDRDAADEARWGRYWMDIGSGPWDAKRRDSEVRLNRLMIVHVDQIRRTGGQIDRAIFERVVAGIKKHLCA